MKDSASRQYASAVCQMLDNAFNSQWAMIEQAASVIAQSLAQEGLLYTFGTGHAHLLSLEVFYRAGGLAQVYPILDERFMLHASASGSTQQERQEGFAGTLLDACPIKPGDVLMVFSNSGRNAVPVEMAMEGKQRGMQVIAMTSLNHSLISSPRNRHGLRLCEVAEIVLDNFGQPGDAVLPLPDGAKIGPTSTVVGAALLEAIVCRAEELAREAGIRLPLFASSNIEGGDAQNQILLEKFSRLIPFL